MHVEVAIPAPVPGTFTYLAATAIPAGSRVIVPFGRREMVGVVTGESKSVPERFAVKEVRSVVDHRPVYSDVLREIAQWMSQYYMHPIGEVYAAMLPASTSRQAKITYQIADKFFRDEEEPEAALVKVVFGKKASLSLVTLRSKMKKLKEANVEVDEGLLQAWVKKGWVDVQKSKNVQVRKTKDLDFYDDTSSVAAPALTLTEKQREIFSGIFEDSPKPMLLWGLTGSGKTELYLQSLARIFSEDAEAQALVLVPEISLTPQMTRVFAARFPGQVAVVHSAMLDTQRWEELEKIRSGKAKILIGPRSAVFGPFRRLKMLIVDEEHDSSYKQASGLTYNGRDIAVLRGQLEKARVVLGSATPSLESYLNAQQGKYRLLKLTERVSGKPLPDVSVLASDPKDKAVVTISRTQLPGEDSARIPIHPEILSALRENHANGQQSIVIVNRRGYAYYLFNLKEKQALACPQCSISLTVHGRSSYLRCHYCDYQVSLRDVLNKNPDDRYVAIGYGSQQAEDFLRNEIPGANIVRLDSDTTTKKDVLPETLAAFGRGEIDILVGTQMLAKGHDFPRVTLTAILEADQILNLPDFRAGERTFQLIVQAAGRAGRDKIPGKVLLQTMRPDHPIIKAGAAQDFEAFVSKELTFRRSVGYPPFARMILIEVSSEKDTLLARQAEKIDQWFEAWLKKFPDQGRQVQILGPSIPPIECVRGRHRRTILLAGQDRVLLGRLASEIKALCGKASGDLRVRLDVDPQSLI